MSQLAASRAPLRTAEGELLQLSVAVDLRQLERVLSTLDRLPFPVNPEIVHPQPQAGTVLVQFPAYDRRMAGVLGSLAQAGLPADSVTVRGWGSKL